MAKYEFAIKKDMLYSGKAIYTPVCRKESTFFGVPTTWNNPWNRITKIYNVYTLLELDFVPELSYEECEEHIKAYQDFLIKQDSHEVMSIELHALETKNI